MQLKPGDEKATPLAGRFLIRKAFPDILQAVSNGSSLQDSLDNHGIAWTSFFRYLEKSQTARDAYARARQMRVEKWIDEMVPMTDKVIGEEMAIVTATRNAVDVRKWVASRLMPNEYGDQPGGVTINNQTNVVVVSDERLRELQALRRKMIDDQKSEVG
jgi:terminase small subunit-like protein